jgi:hypothetical protein
VCVAGQHELDVVVDARDAELGGTDGQRLAFILSQEARLPQTGRAQRPNVY